MEDKLDEVVIPGDILGNIDSTTNIRLGQGIFRSGEKIIATKAGVLRKVNDRMWVESVQKRYVPALEDMVIGIVKESFSEGWKIDIGSHTPASLSLYSFEGGTKKNKPNLQRNSIVYARVTVANKDVEPECSCVNKQGKADGFGHLVGGYLFKCSTGLARKCLDPDSVVLNELGKHIPFEIAVGINGRIWVKSTTPENTILITNAILESEHLDAESTKKLVKKLIQASNEKK